MAKKDALEFENRTVCYIDLLGFSEYVLKRSGDSEKISGLAELLRDVNEKVSDYQGAGLTFQTLSDSIFISTPDCKVQSVQILIACCQDIFIQFLHHGFLARGGISSGNCYVSNSIVIGEPVVKAVKLEQTVAEYPRIVLGKNTVDILNSSPDDFFRQHVVQAEDGPFFIDPFSPLIDVLKQAHQSWKSSKGEKRNQLLVDRSENIETLNAISELLSQKLYDTQENRRVFSFYFWIYNYFRKRMLHIAPMIGDELHVPLYEI